MPYVFFLPVMVAATTLSVGMAAFVGLAFGAVSIAYCFIVPTGTIVAAAFIEAPYIAIFPRILAALGAFGAYKFIQYVSHPSSRAGKFAAVSIAAAIGSLLNTGLVVSMLVLILPSFTLGAVTMYVAVPQMLVSGAIECGCMAALTPPISLTLNRVVLKNDVRKKQSSAGNIGI